MVTIGTPRLVLRRWREHDVPAMAAVNADPEVMRWIGDGRVQPARPAPGHPRGAVRARCLERRPAAAESGVAGLRPGGPGRPADG
ncbi:GNAT family N-acetyltransferase [Kitasatospora sp. NPDC017646]|uniref:GNAT family N-acetyltransferase n=1 Tax=Kitasatospora sp. NPDC017646 TaxID=3364024 RepID=UPI0037A1F24E